MCKQSETKWQAPPSGWAKINVDGAFVSQTSKGSVGIVIRDHECNVLLSAWSVMRHCTSAEEVEATACRDVMVLIKLANEWIKMPLILETDCANVSSVLKATEEDRSQLWNIFQEARLALALSHKYQIVSVSRNANKVAHSLAHLALRNNSSTVWRAQAPGSVSELLAQDCDHVNLN